MQLQLPDDSRSCFAKRARFAGVRASTFRPFTVSARRNVAVRPARQVSAAAGAAGVPMYLAACPKPAFLCAAASVALLCEQKKFGDIDVLTCVTIAVPS